MKTSIPATLLLLFAASSALALDPHVEAVTRSVEGAKGKVEKTDDVQSLKRVDLAVPGAGLHNHRRSKTFQSIAFGRGNGARC